MEPIQSKLKLVEESLKVFMEAIIEKDMEQILQILKERSSEADVTRQTVLLSATLHNRMERLASLSMDNPAYYGMDEEEEGKKGNVGNSSREEEIGDDGDEAAVQALHLPKQVHQQFVSVPCKLRLVILAVRLRSLALQYPDAKVRMSALSVIPFHPGADNK